ncbi:MAG: SDR family NAD(P)-dependent oxidoreductase, partial [Chloroflexi bacterium]
KSLELPIIWSQERDERSSSGVEEVAKTAGVALVTGASRGIGPFIARSLAEAGYSLVLTGRSASELEALADDLKAKGTTAVALPADLTVTEDVETLARTAEREVSRVDVLVNNAGGDPQREFDDMTWAENDAIFQLNVIAPMRLTHLLLPGMLERRRGHIVNISSIAGRVGFPYTEAYAAAKDGLMGFTRVLRNDYRSRGVSASVVVLGAIRDAGQGQRIADQLGMKMPAMGTSPAKAVGKAVVAAIEKDRAEIVVMPGPGRLIKALMDLLPSMGPAMNQATGANATMRSVIEFRRRSRG